MFEDMHYEEQQLQHSQTEPNIPVPAGLQAKANQLVETEIDHMLKSYLE